MESFGTGDRIASSSRVASLVDCGFIDCSSLIGVLYLNERQIIPEIPGRQLERIVPGISTAQLYLPDGNVVDLGKDSVCDLQLLEGGRFVNEQGYIDLQGG